MDHNISVPGARHGRAIRACTVDSKKLEYGPGTRYSGFPSFLGFGVGGQSYSNFLISTVVPYGWEAL